MPSPGPRFVNQGEMLNYKRYENLRCQLCFALRSNRNAAYYHRGILWYHCHLIFILYQKDKYNINDLATLTKVIYLPNIRLWKMLVLPSTNFMKRLVHVTANWPVVLKVFPSSFHKITNSYFSDCNVCAWASVTYDCPK